MPLDGVYGMSLTIIDSNILQCSTTARGQLINSNPILRHQFIQRYGAVASVWHRF